MLTVLEKIGFKKKGTGYCYDFGTWELCAYETHTLELGFCLYFAGFYIGNRQAREYGFYVPLEVDSIEQGLAYLGYYLRKHPTDNDPTWLSVGRELLILLPWEREREEYRRLPKAIFKENWFRVLLNEILLKSKIADPEKLCKISFDGKVFQIQSIDSFIVCPAEGEKWNKEYELKLKLLQNLKQNVFKQRILTSYVWKDHFHFGSKIISLKEYNSNDSLF